LHKADMQNRVFGPNDWPLHYAFVEIQLK
jgi:hypothetical protein